MNKNYNNNSRCVLKENRLQYGYRTTTEIDSSYLLFGWLQTHIRKRERYCHRQANTHQVSTRAPSGTELWVKRFTNLYALTDAEQLRRDEQADRVAHEEDDGGAPDGECACVSAACVCTVCNVRVCVQNKEEEAAAEEAGGGGARAGYLFLMEKSEYLSPNILYHKTTLHVYELFCKQSIFCT